MPSPYDYGSLWFVRYANGTEKYFGTKKDSLYTPSVNATKYAKSQTKLNGAVVSLYEVEPKNYHKYPFKDNPTGSDWYVQKFVQSVIDGLESSKSNGHKQPEFQQNDQTGQVIKLDREDGSFKTVLPATSFDTFTPQMKDPDEEADEELVGHIVAVQTAFKNARKVLDTTEKAMDWFFTLCADVDADDPDVAEKLALIARLDQKKFIKFNDAINDAEAAFEAIIENLEGA